MKKFFIFFGAIFIYNIFNLDFVLYIHIILYIYTYTYTVNVLFANIFCKSSVSSILSENTMMSCICKVDMTEKKEKENEKGETNC